MTPAAILRAAWALIEDPAHWTQGAMARLENGKGCGPDAVAAVCWCAEGARRKAGGNLFDYDTCNFLQVAALGLFGDSFINVNDTLGHDAVRRVYARAIDMAEAGNG